MVPVVAGVWGSYFEYFPKGVWSFMLGPFSKNLEPVRMDPYLSGTMSPPTPSPSRQTDMPETSLGQSTQRAGTLCSRSLQICPLALGFRVEYPGPCTPRKSHALLKAVAQPGEVTGAPSALRSVWLGLGRVGLQQGRRA